jgi:2-dehydropantoate 2-reductase
MKIAVVGAGAVGCYFGGMLARAGQDVVLVGRPRHIEAVLREGLLLETAAFQGHLPVRASVDARAIEGAGIVLCCVKSTDTESVAAQLRPHLASDTLVLCLQNGVDNAARLQALLPCVVAPVVVYVAAEMAGAGHVRHHGRGDLVIGPLPGSAGLVALFGAAGVPVRVSDNVDGELWGKLVINCAYNALSAITRLSYGRLVQGTGIEQVMRAVVDECLAVAQAEGVQVLGADWEAVRAIADTMATQVSSTAQDLARGKRSEIDHLNGHVVRRGEVLGVATPANRVLHAVVKLLEQPRGADGR